MCRLHKDGRGSCRDQTRTTPTKPPSEGEVAVVADLMCRTPAERTQDVEVHNESHCMGKFVLDIRLSYSGYPAYLIKFVDSLGRVCIFGDLNAPNQIATNAIVRSGARWPHRGLYSCNQGPWRTAACLHQRRWFKDLRLAQNHRSLLSSLTRSLLLKDVTQHPSYSYLPFSQGNVVNTF